MSQPGADRNLLFGMLALQMDFITREQLIAAMQSWVFDKSQPLGAILRAQKALAQDRCDLLEALVQKHLDQHNNNMEQSFATICTDDNLRNDLKKIEDTEVQASLEHVSRTQEVVPDQFATAAPTASIPGGETLAPPAPSTPPTAGLRFRILRAHARGGLGQVYVASDEELHREVALKEIQGRHADNVESRSRFLLEAEITGGLEHPGIVPVYGLGTYQDGRPYYAMRFIRGDSLKEAIDRFHKADAAGMDPGQRSLELRALLGRFVDVCNAIAYAHSRGVLHRDLKPGNIMLGKYGETLVVDWGLAKPIGDATPRTAAHEPGEGSLMPNSLSGSSQTLDGTAVGTPQFMSPEQATGRLDQIGPASDVYSLGATLYTLLTGQASVQGPDLATVLHKVERGEIPPPRALKKDVPIALDAICRKAMMLQPQDRYASPRLLADDVEHWLADEPVSAWTEPWTVKARRWVGRHRLLVTSVASAVAVALVGLIIATILLTAANEREFQARKKAEHNFQLARQAVDRYDTKVSESVLLHEPGMEPLRKKLLEDAREFYDQFVKEHINDPNVQGELGRAIFRLAQIIADVDSERKAIPLQEQAIAVFAKLPAAEYQGDLAGSYHHLGRLYRLTDQPAKSEEAYRKALPLWEQLVKEQPKEERYQAGLARTQMGLGNVFQVTRRWDEAQKIDQQALDTRTALALAHPKTAEYQRDLAVNYSNLAVAYMAAGKKESAAEEAYRRALKIQKQLVDDYPTVSQYRNDLARTYFNLGKLEAQTSRSTLAQTSYQKAAELWQALVERHPAVLIFDTLLADAYLALSSAYLQSKDAAKAEDVTQKALTIQRRLAGEHKDNPSYQADLGRGYSSLSAVYLADDQKEKAETASREAVRILDRLARDLPQAPHYQSALARSYRDLGALYQHNNKQEQAKDAFKKALDAWGKLVKDYPDDQEFALGLSAICLELGNVARIEKKLPDALAWYARSVESLAATNRKNAPSASLKEALGNAHWMRAAALTKLERYPEALMDWDQALALVRPAQKPTLQLPRMIVLARTGKYMEATEEAGQLVPQAQSGDALYRFAVVYAVSAAVASADMQRPADERQGLAEQFADRAVQLLTSAKKAGFFKTQANREKLKMDPSLEALRSRPEFMQLNSVVESK